MAGVETRRKKGKTSHRCQVEEIKKSTLAVRMLEEANKDSITLTSDRYDMSFLFLNATNFQMKFLCWLGDITSDNSEGLVSSLAAFLHASPPGDTLDNDRLCPPTF
ncbi:hypothetical protein PV326_011510 [Microctonus aethiopoides]|nr:hypothetical protein PV326_011510 [Microctonus aethiopoides]